MRHGTGVTTALLLLSSSLAGTAEAGAPSLQELYKAAKTGEYMAPYQEDLSQAEQLFQRTLVDPWDSDLKAAWSSLGFDFIEHREGGETFGVLREQADLLWGRGFYVFREKRTDARLLQIPHGFSDLYTGTLGVKLLLEGGFRAAAWNTIPRAEVDLAHTDASHFQALNRAFASLPLATRAIQIHGFAQGKRKSLAGQQADVIISNGTRTPDAAVHTLDDCLTRGTDYTISTYPDEVEELGGTTNAQGRALRAMGSGGFLHVEMSYPLRKAASRSRPLRKALASCLEDR